MSSASSTSATSTQEERAEKIKKAFSLEGNLESRARRRDVERRLENNRHVWNPESSFSHGRRKGIEILLRQRHGFFCDTDDALVWLETVLPFRVDESFRSNRSTYNDAVTWAERFVPKLAEELGADKIHAMVDQLLAARKRPWTQRKSKKGWSYRSWLPTMDDVVQALRIRWVEVVESGKLRGWGSIDPPTPEQIREHDKARKARERREALRPTRSEMTKTADAQALALELGVNERTIRRWRDDGSLDVKVAKRRAVLSSATNDNDPAI